MNIVSQDTNDDLMRKANVIQSILFINISKISNVENLTKSRCLTFTDTLLHDAQIKNCV